MTGDRERRVVETVSGWDGVETGPGRFGSIRFLVGRRELGHLHGDTLLDLPLPPALERELLAEETVEMHRHTPPDSGWVSLRISSTEDVETGIELLRGQYERAIAAVARRDELARAAPDS